MIFRRPSSYSITLKRAHSLLNIPRGELKTTTTTPNVPSREQIQDAFRAAAKRHHPDIVSSSADTANTKTNSNDISITSRQCHEARELLLDYYIRKKYVHPEIIQSVKDAPPPDINEASFLSVWTTITSNRSFQIEAFMRLTICLGLAVGTYYHDKYMPERRERQKKRRDALYSQFGPQPRF